MNLTVGKREVEATSDNDEASNYSSDCVASRKKIKECSEKGSDAQVCSFVVVVVLFFFLELQNLLIVSYLKNR